MADLKITGLTADTSPTSDDLIPTVNDPAGTPANRKVTLANAITKAHGLSDGVAKVSSSVLTTAAQIAASEYPTMVGDSGSGGTKGAVPAPATGDAAASKFLKADGTWAVPAGAGDMVLASVQTVTGAKTFGSAGAVGKLKIAGTTSGAVTVDTDATAGTAVVTIPAVTDTLVGKATTDTLTNKTFDANGTGNSLSNVEVADLAGSAVVTAAEGLASSDNDTSLPTTAAVIDGLDAKQPLDSDLTTIAGLTATTDNFIQSKSSAWASRTPTQVTADLIAMVGDSGSGGTKGLVPAPGAGDAAASKYLKADGTWTAISSSGQTLVTRIVASSGGDHTTLQAALAAASSGDTIYVRTGTFALTASVSSALNNIRIVGENPQTSIINMATYTLTFSGTNVVVEGIKLIADSASTGNLTISGTDSWVKNCWLLSANTTSNYINLTGTNNKITDNLIQTSATTNVNLISASGTGGYKISGNYFKLAGVSNNASEGVIRLSATNDCQFTDNFIYSDGGANASGHPLVYVAAGNNNSVTANQFYAATQRSTFVTTSAATLNNISGNIIYQAYTGVNLTTSKNNVSGNFIYSPSTSGYCVHSQAAINTISGNQFVGGSTSGTLVRATADSNTITGNVFNDGQYGVRLPSGSDNNTVSGNVFRCSATGMYGVENSGTNNVITGNQFVGFSTAGGRAVYADGRNCVVSGNVMSGMGTGIQASTNATYSSFTGNSIDSVATGFDLSSDYSVWSGNVIRNTTTNITYGTHNKSNTVLNNQGAGINAIHETKIVWMKNTSGGALAAGDVVVWKAVAAGNEITTTTTAGDDKVFGVCTEAIADTAFGPVQVLGKTTLLKADGTTDIAVGDFLTTFTTAKIAAKAAAGDQAFAIALEAYTTDDSNGVIDALLIEPRMI